MIHRKSWRSPVTDCCCRVHYQPDSAAARCGPLLLGADHVWRAPLEEWRQWTPMPPLIDSQADGKQWAMLNGGKALALRIDACTSEMWIDADPKRLHETKFEQTAFSNHRTRRLRRFCKPRFFLRRTRWASRCQFHCGPSAHSGRAAPGGVTFFSTTSSFAV